VSVVDQLGVGALALLLLQLGAGTAFAQQAPPTEELMVLGESGARLLLDGQPVGQLPLQSPLLVAPGSHQLTLDSRQRKMQATVDVRPGSFVDVRFDEESGAAVVSQPPTALVSLSYRGSQPGEQTRLNQAVLTALSKEGLHRRLPPPATDGPAASCSDPVACQLAAARQAQIPYVLLLQSVQQGRSWQFECSLGSATLDELAASQSQRCDDCSVDQAADQLEQLSRRVIGQGLTRPQGRLTVRSQPIGATVTWNGRPLGPTPIDRPIYSGRGELVVSHPDFRPEHRQLAVAAGQPTPIELVLHPQAEADEPEPEPALLDDRAHSQAPRQPPVEYSRRPTWRLVSGGAALASSALLLGFGIGALNLAGSCIDAPSAPAQRCDQLYATQPLGAGLTVSGALLTVAGTLLLALPGHRRPPSPLDNRE
jgi:hypothetical protein